MGGAKEPKKFNSIGSEQWTGKTSVSNRQLSHILTRCKMEEKKGKSTLKRGVKAEALKVRQSR